LDELGRGARALHGLHPFSRDVNIWLAGHVLALVKKKATTESTGCEPCPPYPPMNDCLMINPIGIGTNPAAMCDALRVNANRASNIHPPVLVHIPMPMTFIMNTFRVLHIRELAFGARWELLLLLVPIYGFLF